MKKLKINENNNYFELIKTKKKKNLIYFLEEIKQKINFVVVVVAGLFDTIH